MAAFGRPCVNAPPWDIQYQASSVGLVILPPEIGWLSRAWTMPSRLAPEGQSMGTFALPLCYTEKRHAVDALSPFLTSGSRQHPEDNSPSVLCRGRGNQTMEECLVPTKRVELRHPKVTARWPAGNGSRAHDANPFGGQVA